jgi:hypothetical protein
VVVRKQSTKEDVQDEDRTHPLDEKDEAPKTRINDEEFFWLNKTKSGKGVIIVLDDQAYISSLVNITEFASGLRKGVKFSLLERDEEE